MISYYHHLALYISIIFLGRLAFIQTAYLGCYQDSPVSRELYGNPGNYNPSSIDATECEILCGTQGYGYAGLTAGKLCLCGPTMTGSTSGTCDALCPGDVSQTCGTSDIYNSVYTALVIMTGFKISPANDILETYALTTINFNLTSGSGVIYSGKVYDGGPNFGPLSTQYITYHIRQHGRIVMTATATNGITTLKDETVLQVQTRVKSVTVSCPSSVEIHTQFECILLIAMGTNMDIHVDMDDGTVYQFISPDTIQLTTGMLFGVTSGVTYPGDMLYVMPEHIFTTNGTLVAVEFISDTTGVVYIQVYRPGCSSGLYYCPKSNACINDGLFCNTQILAARWKQQCNTGQMYSVAKRQCVDMVTESLISNAPIQDWSQMNFHNYTLTGELSINIPTTGEQFYEIPDNEVLSVQKGDILALKEPSGKIAVLDATGKNYEFYYDVNSDGRWLTRLSSGFDLDTTPNTFAAQHAIKAYLEKPSKLKFRHTFNSVQLHLNVTATVHNNVTNPSLKAVALIENQVPISNVMIIAPFAASTNGSVLLTVASHNGTSPEYTWNFGTGVENTTTFNYIPYSYNESGVYIVTVTASNDISSATNSCAVIVQDTIQGLSAPSTDTTTIFGNMSTVFWNISQGTNVSYTTLMGDDYVYTLSYPFTGVSVGTTITSNTTTDPPVNIIQYNGSSNGMEGFISHRYLSPGWYTFTLVAENHISKMNITFYFAVQILITGLIIQPTNPIPFYNTREIYFTIDTGSHLQLNASINGSTLPDIICDETTSNGTVMILSNSYNAVGSHYLEINITNLVSPIVSETLEVWIDYRITNLSIGIDRSYIPVDDNMTFNIGMQWCSRFTSYIDFVDGSPIETTYYDLLMDPEKFNYTHAFTFPGVFSVNFTIENPVDYHNSQHDVYVQYGVKNIDVQWTKTVRIEPGSAGLGRLWVRFMGGVPLPTSASCLINFDDNTTSTHPLEEPIIESTTKSFETTEGINCDEVFSLCNTSSNDTQTTQQPVNTTVPQCPYMLLTECLATTPSPVTIGTTSEPTAGTTIADDFFSIPVDHEYSLEATYDVTVNISNLVSYMYFTLTFEVDKPIYDLILIAEPSYVVKNAYASLNVSMSWGSRVICAWYIGDGTPSVSADCDHYSQTSYSHLFTQVGVFHPEVYAINAVSSSNVSSSTGPIIVQVPVTKFSLRCPVDDNKIGPPWFADYKTNVTFELLWEYWQNEYPTNASYTIDFGDGTVTSPVLLKTTFDNQNHLLGKHLVFDLYHTYLKGGNYTVSINIMNLVSNETYTVSHDIYEALVGLDVNIFDYNPATGQDVVGGGLSQNYFTLENPVKFVASHQRGSHVTYTWKYGDQIQESFYYEKEAFHMYDKDTCFTTELTAKNFHNELKLTRFICIQRGCFNISIFCDNPRAKNSTFIYQIDPGTVGTDACYMINFNSDMAYPYQYIMFGDATQCSVIPEWSAVWNDPDKLWFEKDSDVWYSNKTDNPTNYNISVDSTFIFEGYYDVSLFCQNKVSNTQHDFRVGVTKGPCWWPYVNVSEPNKCIEPFCDHDTGIDDLKTHYKSEKLVVKSDVIINCTATKIAYFYWQVFYIDESSMNETEIANLSGADVYSIGARQLILEPRTLDYGLYRIRLNVSMNEVIGMISVDECYIRIIPSPLQFEINGGDFMMRRWGDENALNIDALSLAFDPDVDPTDKSGMTFIWMCRRLCETWPKYRADFTIKRKFKTNCTYSIPDDRGCSKVDKVDTSGILPNASGGMLDTLFSGDMYENDEVEIKAYLIKGDRIVHDTQRIYIAEGDPPIVGIKCITNCASKMNTDSRFGLETYINGWTRGVYFYYRWVLYGRSWYGGDNAISTNKWESFASTGSEGPNMAILPNCPLLQSNSSMSYYFRVKTWRWGTSEKLCGWAEKSFMINERPSSASAYVFVTPTVGIAYETNFKIQCGGFYDYENDGSFKLYKFGYRSDYNKAYIWFHKGDYPNNIGSEGPIPDGLPENGYMVEIVARAYDHDGAFADALTYIRVDPANQQDVSDILANATSEEGIVNNLFVGADIKIAPVAKCLGKFLNEEADNAPSDQDIIATTMATTEALNLTDADRLALEQEMKDKREADKARRTETRQAIMDGFKRIQTGSVEAVQNTAAALSELTLKEDELSETAQEDAVEILRSYTDQIGRETHISADDREETAITLVEVLGNMMHAAGYMAEKAEDESTALYNDYMQSVSTTPSGTSSQALSPAQYQQIQNELARQKAKGKDTFLKIESQSNDLIKTISSYKVVGEKDAILESKKLNITLRKRMTIEMNDNPIIEVGGQSSVLMPKYQSIFGDTGNETSWFVETEAIRMPNNPFTWTDTSSSAAQKISSDVVSLKYRNDTGGEVLVRDNAQMFDLFVDRSNYDTSVTVVRNITRDWHESMVLHSVNIENTGSLHIKLEQILNITDMIDYIEQMIEYDNNNNNTNGTQTEFALELKPVEWYVFIRANDPPTTTEYDFTCTLPLSDEELDNMMSYVDGMAFENDTSAERSTYIDIQPDRYTCFFTSDFLSINESTKYYIGIKHKLQNMSEDDPLYWFYYSTLPPTTTTVPTTTTTITYTTTCWTETKGGKGRRKRAGKGGNTNIVCSTYPPTPKPKKRKKPKATPAPTLPPEPAYKQAVYRLSIFSAYCIWWDATIDQWSNDGCVVGPLSTPDRIHCLSSHLTSFAAGFAVPMNTIDLNDSAFSKLDENPIIFCTMVSMMCLYILMCVWARKRDMVDKIMAGSSPLLDNDPRDKYLYEIQVFTGSRKEAGTTAKVSFVLTGDKDETQPRFLADDKRPVLQTSNTDGFVMAVPKPLGKLTHLRIWHDNMGTNPSWYFSRMQIEDLQTGDKYFFICENWLSLDDDDGLIDRVIPVAGRAELTSFNYLFWTKTKYTLADGHLWFSIFKRPAKSNFTRVQRLTCCLSLLFCTMCTSIAFYQSDESSSPKEYGVGPVTFTLTGLYIGIASGLMSFPVNLIIMCFFRYSKPFPKRIEETLAYRFYSKFLCFSCFKKKVNTMEEKQAEELKKDLVGNARKREKSDLDTDAVKIELENELDLIDNDDYFNKDQNVKKENVEDSSKFLDKDRKKPSAELNPIPRVLKLKKDLNKKKPLRLPYWGIYIGYVLSFCTVAVAFWATVEFGGVFGPKKSLEWLISFFVSCIESIFFSQPIKVIIIAIIYATIIKKPEANDEDNNDRDLEDGEEWLHTHLTEDDLKNPSKLRELEKIKLSAPLPPELDFLKTAKEERAHEIAMYALLKEIAICVFFLYFVLLIAYTNRDPWSYYQYSTYNNMFNLGTYSPTYSTQFKQISSIDHFWNWTQNALLNSLFYTDWYNGDVYTETDRLIQDKQTILVGSARLRQLRTKPYKCIAPLNYLIDYCRDGYSHFSENTDNYKLGWEPVNTSDPSDVPNELFTYKTSDDIGGYPYWGIFSTYGGGGYVTELGTTMTDASSTVDTIMNNNWVDNNTRAIFIEVNLYNPNNNLFGICLYVLEFLQTGGIEPFERFFIFRLDRYSGGFMYFVMAIELITVVFILFYTVKEVQKIRKMKVAYFKEFWNVWEIIVLAMAYGLILVFIYRTVISIQMMKKIRDNPNTFVNFFFAIVWDECCGYFIGLLVYMETLRFLRLLRFNRKVALFGSTMMYISKPLLSFGLVFMSGFLAFSTTAYFFFNTYMFDFRTFMATLNTLLSMMLGKFDYEAAWTSTRVAGPIVFGMFALCFNFILVNFFLTIVIDGFQVVRNDLSKQSNDYEVIDHMMKKIKMVMGIDVPKKRKGASFSVDPRLHQFTYIEGKTSDQEILDELNGKVENVIQKCNGLAEFPEDDELEEELNEVQNRKRRKIVVG